MNYLIFDFESTGLNTALDEPLTAFFILADNSFNIIDTLSLTFKPDIPKDKWNKEAELVHGITWDQAQKFNDPKDSLDKLIRFIPPKDVCAVCFANYNTVKVGKLYYGKLYFDFSLLRFAFDRHREYNSWLGVFQKRLSVHTLWKLINKNADKKDKKKGATKAGLLDVCQALDVKVRTHHDSKDDTYMTYECLKEIASKYGDITKYLEPWFSHRHYIDMEVVNYDKLWSEL